MSLLLSRGGRKGPIACLVALIFIFALYQLGIICGSTKYGPTAMMVSKEVRQFCNESVISRVRFEVKSKRYVLLRQMFAEGFACCCSVTYESINEEDIRSSKIILFF
jgi:hypothetical protein